MVLYTNCVTFATDGPCPSAVVGEQVQQALSRVLKEHSHAAEARLEDMMRSIDQ